MLPTSIEVRAIEFNSHVCSPIGDPDEAVQRLRSSENLTWLQVVVLEPDEGLPFLTEKLGVHELHAEDALSDRERPALHEDHGEIFLVVPAIAAGSERDSYLEVGFFLTAHGLVTVTRAHCPALDTISDRWLKLKAPLDLTPDLLLHAVLDVLIDGYFPVVDAIEDEVDDVSDLVFQGDTSQVASILRLKRRLLEMRRRLAPTREILNGLLRHDVTEISARGRPYFQDLLDHVLRLSESLDLHRETLASILDVHVSTISNQLSTVMKKLTVISTVLMAMALIAGIYGMNFDKMPELRWPYGYPMAIGLMVSASITIVTLFRWKKWI